MQEWCPVKPSPLNTAANCLPHVQNIVRVSHAGLLQVLQHRHTKRHNLNSLLLHALRHWWGQGSVLCPRHVSLQLSQLGWLSGPTPCNLHLMPHTDTQSPWHSHLSFIAHNTYGQASAVRGTFLSRTGSRFDGATKCN